MTERSRAQSTQRPKRTPLGLRNVLTTEQRKGYVRRWFNVEDDRIERAEAAGYTVVNDPNADTSDEQAGKGSRLGSAITKSVGGGVRAVLMEIPENYYQEDQAVKQQDVDATEEGLRPRNDVSGAQYGGSYGETKISRKGKTRVIDA